MTTHIPQAEPGDSSLLLSSGGPPAEGPGGTSRPSDPPTDLFFYEFCIDCFAPCQMTDRGPFCDEHYGAHRTMCEPCGQNPAETVINGVYSCLNEYCLSEAGWSV